VVAEHVNMICPYFAHEVSVLGFL